MSLYVGVSPLRMDSPSCDTYRLVLFCAVSGDPSPRTDVMFMIVLSWGGGFTQLSFMYVLFSFNLFLITHFRVVLSFQPPLDHNTLHFVLNQISCLLSYASLFWWKINKQTNSIPACRSFIHPSICLSWNKASRLGRPN